MLDNSLNIRASSVSGRKILRQSTELGKNQNFTMFFESRRDRPPVGNIARIGNRHFCAAKKTDREMVLLYVILSKSGHYIHGLIKNYECS